MLNPQINMRGGRKMEHLLQIKIYKKIKYAVLIGAAASQLMAVSVQAEELLSPLLVTAGRVAEDAGRVSADVTVVDKDRIEQSQAQNVVELLRSEAGINVVGSGGPGKASSLFLRGADGGQTLVLIDGVRVGAATTGSFDWGSLSTLNIDRIEIVRGPQSTLYGADAMGGVIQIFTRKGKGDTKVTVDSEFGSRYGDRLLRMQTNGSSQSGVQYALAGETRRGDGISIAASGSESDMHRLTSLSGRVSFPLGSGELELTARSHQSKNGLDGGFPFGDVQNFTSDSQQDVLSLKGSYPLTDYWDVTLQLSQSMDELANRDPITASNNADIKNRTQQLVWQNSVEFDAFSLLAGMDFRRDRGVNSGQNLNQEITQQAGFTTLTLHQESFDLHGGVRLDRNSRSADKTTYRLGGVLRPLDGVKLMANYGTGFKAPSINDLYWPATAFGAGNPNLKPEESRGWDLGVEVSHKGDALNWSLNVVWFDQRFKSLIDWAETAPFFWQPSNVNSATTRGLELTGSLEHDVVFLRGNWTLLDAKNDADGTLLIRRPKESGSITIGAKLFAIQAELQMNIVGPRFSGSGNSQPMSGYVKSDFRVAYAINGVWKLKFRMENVEDKKYEEIVGYGVPGRSSYFGMSATF
ncbi:TonB-dependent receptor domain-containing protein [Pseudomonadota bacterium]